MVKKEYCTDSEDSSDVEFLDKPKSAVGSSALSLKREEDCPNSSSSYLKSYFVGMGFLPALVDKVLEENGEGNAEVLLEVLIAQSDLQKQSPDASNSFLEFSCSQDEETNSAHESKPEGFKASPSLEGDKRSYLLNMKFSGEEVDLAIKQLGENASLAELVDCIVTAQAGSSFNASLGNGLEKHEEVCDESLFGMMEKTSCLLQMGFTEVEVSTAIDNFGPEVPILELADLIFASRLVGKTGRYESVDGPKIKTEPDYSNYAPGESEYYDTGMRENSVDGAKIKIESDYPDHALGASKYCATGMTQTATNSNYDFYDYEEKVRVKKMKNKALDNCSSSWSNASRQSRLGEGQTAQRNEPSRFYGRYGESSNVGSFKEEVPEETGGVGNNVRELLSTPPYFFYGNVVDISEETWKRLAQFLYGIQPEFVNTQFFSALIRKEGYIHNLPSGQKFFILPRPPMAIEDALPHTKKWWPSWDTRKQLSCINSETTGVSQICGQLGRMMNSQGMLSTEQRTNILHHCKTLNLIWVERNTLRPIQPEQLEYILGYPRDHTEIWGLEPDERLKALKYSFQTDTLGYYLSVMKDKYPAGMKVLSVCTGTGGGIIALHRLGIHLKCVVSIESSEVYRNILRRWWKNTGQPGELRHVEGIEKLTTSKLEGFMQEFEGFDIVIGGNPGPYASGISTMSSSMGMDQNTFFEFVRIFQRVRSMMGRN